ncbi:Peptide chain release factor N(5)-glutamine methyltransferase [hydrothermal vent metagenome]|uniref:peptide chain release factor N(5)-glutamine methyltransferase n=1 Tax=hydrothermal vent metagenome TaxID=652676 RepID=A0A3B1CUT0_9ZZZZ
MTRTFLETIVNARRRLTEAGVTTPGLDAELLLAHALEKDRAFLLARMNEIAPEEILPAFEKLLSRRAMREPLAYITGEKEFYSRPFKVDPRVLIPRPETEGLVDMVFELYDEKSVKNTLDIGTGSGAIAVTISLGRPLWRVTATDSSPSAVEAARENILLHKVEDRVALVESDLFDSLPETNHLPETKYDIIVFNPPYIAEGGGGVDPEVRLYEPTEALYSGRDGMDMIRRFTGEAPLRLENGGYLVFEIGEGQSGAVENIINDSEKLSLKKIARDLSGAKRVVVARKKRSDG